MKKLLLLAAVAAVTASSTGCQCGPIRLWWQCITAQRQCQQAIPCDPCMGTCGPAPFVGDPYIGPPPTLPGTIIPGPIQ